MLQHLLLLLFDFDMDYPRTFRLREVVFKCRQRNSRRPFRNIPPIFFFFISNSLFRSISPELPFKLSVDVSVINWLLKNPLLYSLMSISNSSNSSVELRVLLLMQVHIKLRIILRLLEYRHFFFNNNLLRWYSILSCFFKVLLHLLFHFFFIISVSWLFCSIVASSGLKASSPRLPKSHLPPFIMFLMQTLIILGSSIFLNLLLSLY